MDGVMTPPSGYSSDSTFILVRVCIIEDISNPFSLIVTGYWERAFSSRVRIYALTPLDRVSTSRMPIMPILPANAVSAVLPFLLRRLVQERLIAVESAIEDFSLILRFLMRAFIRSKIFFFSSAVL